MNDFERLTATGNSPGYDGSAEVLQQRQAAMHALINGGVTPTGGITQADEPYYPATALGSPGVNKVGTPDIAGSPMGADINFDV